MTTPFHYSTTYILDKDHFSETFDESSKKNDSVFVYGKSMGLLLLGFAILYFSDILPYAAWFIVVLGVVDALSIYFRKPWWLVRQMISSEANLEITLTIDNTGIGSKSHKISSKIAWSDISHIEKTVRGWLIHHSAGRTYLSAGCLSDKAIEFVNNQAK
ncbi:YcxB family protein [Glaciecola petra]|uniref:YcxB family protein n=1 Tax=Glaciecola petra TaxID=3075602 RepID=A0ABU2ZUR4_9ALTE|nr:YcxB family protein [Aestuariibacter sp. P117]MDT0596387.1 YcxB family protein [Aestuariibacter sp. P117]